MHMSGLSRLDGGLSARFPGGAEGQGADAYGEDEPPEEDGGNEER